MSAYYPTGSFDLFPNPLDYNTFYKCYYGEAVLIPCPIGLYFNVTQQICDWPSESGCTPGENKRRLKVVACWCPNGNEYKSARCRINGSGELCTPIMQGSNACYNVLGTLKCKGAGIKFGA